MEITRNSLQPSGKGSSDYFTGTVRVDPLFQSPEPAAPVSPSSPVRVPPGTPIRWGNSLSSPKAGAGPRPGP